MKSGEFKYYSDEKAENTHKVQGYYTRSQIKQCYMLYLNSYFVPKIFNFVQNELKVDNLKKISTRPSAGKRTIANISAFHAFSTTHFI